MDVSPPGSSVHGILQQVLECVVKLSSRKERTCPTLTVAYQAPPSMGFSRQECWSGLPFPSPGDLPDPGIKPGFPALRADVLLSEPPGKPLQEDLPNPEIEPVSLLSPASAGGFLTTYPK